MTSINISENQPYMISLDILDLQYMDRNINRTNDHIQPIWNKTSKDSYYEFQVIPDNESTTTTLKSDADLEQILCHICDIQVPIHFIKEHYKSDKHNTFRTIAEAAIQRITKNINNYVEIKEENFAKNIYYCDVCSETVHNMMVHNASKKHLKSVKFDNAIKSLMCLYLDKNAINDFNVINMSDQDHHTLMNKNQKDNNNTTYHDDDNTSMHVELSNDGSSDAKLSIISMAASKDNNFNRQSKVVDMVKTQIARDSDDFKFYITDMARKFSLKEPKIKVNGDLVVVYSAKGEEYSVTIDHFHGFVTNNGIVTCNICKQNVSGDTNIHKKKKDHVVNIFKPLDQYFIRKINDDWNHCVICNTRFIWDAKYHAAEDLDHRNKLKNITGLPSNSKQTFCKSCNRYIDTHNYNSHINSMKHKQQSELTDVNSKSDVNPTPKNVADNKYTIPELKNAVPKNVLGNKDSVEPKVVIVDRNTPTNLEGVSIKKDVTEIQHQMKKVVATPNYMKEGVVPHQTQCTICSVYVPNTLRNISDHINANKHKSNLSKLLDGNKIIVVRDDYHCELCNIKVNDLIEHIKAENHINFLSNFCFVCNVKVPSRGMAIHEAGKPHELKLSTSLSTSEVQSSNKTVKTSCEPVVPDNEVKQPTKSYSQIVIGSAVINDGKTNASNTVANPSKASVDVALVEVILNKMWQTKRTDNDKELLCRICETVIPNKIDHVKEHIEGKKHISKCTNMLTENFIKESLSGYKCEVCTVNDIKDFISHVNTDLHKRQLHSKNNPVKNEYCEICEKKVIEILDHEKEFSHEVILYGLLKNNLIDNNNSEYYCTLCKICFDKRTLIIHIKSTLHSGKVGDQNQAIRYNYCEICDANVDINEHEESLMHQVKVNTIQTTNKIKKSNNNYYCAPCKQTIFKISLLVHIKNDNHVTNLERFNNDMKTEHCDVCQIEVKEYEHEEGVAHKARLFDLLKGNKIIFLSGNYFCDVCKCDISKTELATHAQCEKHRNNLLNPEDF